MQRLEVAISLRNRMRIQRPVARVLANAYYGLDLYAGCHNSRMAKEARAITINRAFLIGGLDDKGNLTGVGLKMLVAYRARKKNRATSGTGAPEPNDL